MEPIDIKSFNESPAVQVIIETINNPPPPSQITPPKDELVVKVDDKTGDNLNGGKEKIEGLNPNKYYMVEKEVNADGVLVIGYPKFVSEHPSLAPPGQLTDKLGYITRSGGNIINLVNLHTYTVRAAVSFFDGMVFNYSDSASVNKNQPVSVINGAITIPAPRGDITLDNLKAFNGYDVMGVAVIPAADPSKSPFKDGSKKISDTESDFQLEGADTETDYIFFKTGDPVNFFVLKVIIGATPPTVINEKTIQGVSAPAAGVKPVTAITPTNQYTGTVSWSPDFLPDGTFKPLTAYTATITLTAKQGYTLDGVGANFFTVAGATPVTNPVDSGVITAAFPATGVLPPATGNFKITFTIAEDFAGITPDNTSFSRSALFGSAAITSMVKIVLNPPKSGGNWSSIEWSISGITIGSSNLTQTAIANDTLVINNSATFWELLKDDHIDIYVTVIKDGKTYSFDNGIRITITN